MMTLAAPRTFDGIRPRKRATVRGIASPAMDYDIPSYLRRPTAFALERRAAKKAARQALMRDILAAALMLIAIVLTLTLAVVSAIPAPEPAHAQEIAPSAPVEPAKPLPAPKPAGSPVYAVVTAYSSSPDETDDTPFIAASGAHVYDGTLACPAEYEFGTKVLIEGKEYTCEDRMNARYRGQQRFDVWMPSKADALAYGTKQITIEIL